METKPLSSGQKAMAVAEDLAADGKRKNGRWRRNSLSENLPIEDQSSEFNWLRQMSMAGLVLDHTPDLVDAIISGDVALSAAYDQVRPTPARVWG